MQPENSGGQDGPSRRGVPAAVRSRSRVARCLIAGAAALLVATQPLSIGSTEATWQDSEAGRGSFSSVTIAPPVIQGCVLTSAALGLDPVITVQWRLPANPVPVILLANIRFYTSIGTSTTRTNVTAGVSTTGPVNGVYTTTFGPGLLAGLLGGSYKILLQAEEKVAGTGWRSKLAVGDASMAALGLNKSCAVGANVDS